MSVFKVASRYAKSLIDLAQEHQNLDAVKADMSDVVAVIKSNTELQAVLNNPIIKTDKKLAILKALFQDKVKPEILEFFNIMGRKGRAELVYATALEFIREYNEVKGIVNAEVILANKVDKSLIGGFVVKVGDKQIDASIQGKLNKLERHFESQGV